jgi:ankyrin repeat protein
MTRSRTKGLALLALGLVVLAGLGGLAGFYVYGVQRNRLNDALVRAADDGDVAAVQALLEQGANLNAGSVSLNTETALMRAAATGRRELVQFLLDRGADPNVRHTGIGQLRGRTALMFAVDGQQAGVVAILLDGGADVNVRDELGETPLTLALERGYLDIARTLVDRGADVNVQNRFGRPALILAVERLHSYAGLDRTAVVNLVKAMLDRGADVNARDSGKTTLTVPTDAGLGVQGVMIETSPAGGVDGRTPLMIAARAGNIEIVQALLAKGADVNAKDSEGKTALELAKERGDAKVVELLKQSGAKE